MDQTTTTSGDGGGEWTNCSDNPNPSRSELGCFGFALIILCRHCLLQGSYLGGRVVVFGERVSAPHRPPRKGPEVLLGPTAGGQSLDTECA